MKLNHFPRARPDAFFAIRAPFLDDLDLRFHEFDGIFGTNADTATAVVAFAGNDVDHQRLVDWHGV